MENFVPEFLISNSAEPSPFDKRDWMAETIYSENIQLPETVDYRFQLHAVRNQGLQGTCAAQTAACMKEWQEKKDVDFNQYMSPQFIYNNRENQISEGMYGRDVMRILSNLGSCSEKSYPYHRIDVPEGIDKKVYDEAKNYKIKSYAQVNTIDGLKKALYVNGPCYISFIVYNNGIKMWKPKKGDKRLGGHAMTVVGYNKDGFIIRNSWGPYWGDKGYCYYPYSEWGSHMEIWTTIDDMSYQEPEVTPVDPTPIDNNKPRRRRRCCLF